MELKKEKVFSWLKKNWYPIELTVTCFLIAIEVFPIWTAWAAIFGAAVGMVIYKIAKK
jgi:hypothetical protein